MAEVFRKMAKEFMEVEKEMSELTSKKREIEHDLVSHCIDHKLYDFFKIDHAKIRRSEGLPPHHKHL